MPYALQTLTLASFVDRDMFMRYAGGGVGHAAATETKTGNNNDAMDVDDDNAFTVDADQVRNAENEPELEDSRLLDELRRVVEGEMAGDREMEDLMDDDNGEADDVGGEDDASGEDDVSGEDEEDTTSEADSEEEDGGDFGPEDGEDELDYDTRYGAL
jgi:hypothetical protein